MRYIPNPETIAVLEYAENMLTPWRLEPRTGRHERNFELETPTRQLATLRARLLFVDQLIGEFRLEGQPLYAREDPSRFEWLTYLEEVKVVPIYDDAIAVMRHRPLVKPEEVANLLLFTSVGGSNFGVDDGEDHGFGYHFHFGKVKKSILKRVNTVLTFDPVQAAPPNSHDPLFSEEHGSGRYDHIDVSTIGNNVRLPVYSICQSEMLILGKQNFKKPAAKALLFY